MRQLIRKLLGKCNKEYLSYDEYSAKVKFIDEFNFQQSTRKQNISNLEPIGSDNLFINDVSINELLGVL